jgi:hypothetical protein
MNKRIYDYTNTEYPIKKAKRELFVEDTLGPTKLDRIIHIKQLIRADSQFDIIEYCHKYHLDKYNVLIMLLKKGMIDTAKKILETSNIFSQIGYINIYKTENIEYVKLITPYYKPETITVPIKIRQCYKINNMESPKNMLDYMYLNDITVYNQLLFAGKLLCSKRIITFIVCYLESDRSIPKEIIAYISMLMLDIDKIKYLTI